MSKKYKTSLFIHRRDLRVQDNTALNLALMHSEQVLSCFMFDPVQISEKNKYRSEKHVSFMIECLEDLKEQYKKVDGKLYVFYGEPHLVIEELIKKEGIEAVYVNADYTPYSKTRDEKISAVCKKWSADFFSHHDILLMGDPESVTNGQGKPMVVFTPFWKRAAALPVPKVQKIKTGRFYVNIIKSQKEVSATDFKPSVVVANSLITGGRYEGRKIIQRSEVFKNYAKDHNTLSLATTRLSAHNKFGTISVREVYHSFGRVLGYHHPLIRQMYWRDFYTYIVYHFPYVIGGSYDKKHEKLFWNDSLEGFEEWKEGRTGIPIVDAGMREVNATGYMHNRARLIVGSFLTKDLHIAWWHGEEYFAQKLIDYDVCVNNGNWQWVGGTGVDPVPYFRIFNPWLQAQKFDPEALYIKQWVPELKDLTAKQIHNLFKVGVPDGTVYPKPMVDHSVEAKKVKAKYV